MPSAKENWFPAESGLPPVEPERLLQILGHKTRLELTKILTTEGETTAGVLQYELETSQPNLAYHLRLLRQAGIITVRHTELRAYYQLSDSRVPAIIAALKTV